MQLGARGVNGYGLMLSSNMPGASQLRLSLCIRRQGLCDCSHPSERKRDCLKLEASQRARCCCVGQECRCSRASFGDIATLWGRVAALAATERECCTLSSRMCLTARQLLDGYDPDSLDRFDKAKGLRHCSYHASSLREARDKKSICTSREAFDLLKSKEKAYKKLLDRKQLHDGRFQAHTIYIYIYI